MRILHYFWILWFLLITYGILIPWLNELKDPNVDVLFSIWIDLYRSVMYKIDCRYSVFFLFSISSFDQLKIISHRSIISENLSLLIPFYKKSYIASSKAQQIWLCRCHVWKKFAVWLIWTKLSNTPLLEKLRDMTSKIWKSYFFHFFIKF